MASQFHLVGRIAVDVETPTGGGEGALLHPRPGRHLEHLDAAGMPALSRFTAVRFDLPGSGRSHRVEGALSIDALRRRRCRRVLASCRMERAMWSAIRWAPSSRPIWPRASPGSSAAWRCSARCWRRPTWRGPAWARGAKARGEGVAGMQAIADALVQAATSAETRARRPAAVAYVREIADAPGPDGYARTCDALAEAQPADASRDRLPDRCW